VSAVLRATSSHSKAMRPARISSECECPSERIADVLWSGHEPAVADLVKELRRDQYHGLTVVGACVAGPGERDEMEGVPVYGGLDDTTAAVKAFECRAGRHGVVREAAACVSLDQELERAIDDDARPGSQRPRRGGADTARSQRGSPGVGTPR